MEVLHLTHPMDKSLGRQEPHVMALGFFDGVHLGHQFLLQQAMKIAKEKNLNFTVMTFDPHPDEIIKCKADRRYLTPLPSKLERISAFGVDKTFVMRFNLHFSSLPASDFINQYIVGLNAKHIVAGFDFTFGYKAQGDVESLLNTSINNPFEVTIISKRTTENNKISSTLIKKLINDGDVHLVPHYLGRHYEINGSVQQSNSHTQKKLNNIEFQIHNKYILPKPGLYKVEITNRSRTSQGFLRCCDSSENSYELSSNEIGWLKECDPKEIKVKFLNPVAYTSAISL